MSTPTKEQIAIVKENLKNMQALNDYVHTHGQAKILNAYLLMSEKDDSDPGLAVVLNLMAASFRGIGAVAGPIGTAVSSFVAGMMNSWANKTPPSLNGTFASYISLFSATAVEIDKTLATYHEDVAGNWGVTFTYDDKKYTLADLAESDFPPETNPKFEDAAKAALLGLDKDLWKTMLAAKFVITTWEMSSGPTIFPGKKDKPPIEWAKKFYAKHPAYYETWTWHKKSGCGDSSGWEMTERNLGTGAGLFKDGSISKDACAYLFKDSTEGTIINAKGLYTRKTVFTELGIPERTHVVSTGGGIGGVVLAAKPKVSKGYLKAMKEGRTLSALVDKVGRDELHRKVMEKVKSDEVFAHNVARRPRESLEALFEVRIPEVVTVNVVVETPNTFGLVIPLSSDPETC